MTVFYLTFWAPQVVPVEEKLPANSGSEREGDLIPGSGRSPGGERGNPLQYSCLENPMDREARRPRGDKESDMTERLSTPACLSLARLIVENHEVTIKHRSEPHRSSVQAPKSTAGSD